MSNTKTALCLTAILYWLLSLSLFAQKPKWIGNTPKELNYTYKFVEVVSTGMTLESARASAKNLLTDDNQIQEGVKVYRNTRHHTSINQQYSNNGKLHETTVNHIDIDVTVDGEKFDLQAVRVDEYAERRNRGYILHTLYMVALCENPVFDRTYITNSYGAAPVFMSIIPGAGQWYKGNKVKGACMFAASAASVAGILVCENLRSSYHNKAIEQPKYTKEYNSKSDNYATGRNICIGVAAAVWLYNFIDAACAKGARRVKVKRAGDNGISFQPLFSDKSVGIALAYHF